MPANQSKKFFRSRTISNRFPTAPDTMTLPEVMFYTGASLRTVRNWTREWELSALVGPKGVAIQIAGPGSPWTVRKTALISWLVAFKHVRLPVEYGFPSKEQALAVFEGKSLGSVLPGKLK
jgi:hypothetical protein